MTAEQLEVRKYPLIHVTVDGDNHFHCLNEVSIRSSIIKTFVMDVLIDDLHFETFRGDGMIISTPTGGTAYNKSVSGAVVDPLISCMQVSELASLNNNTYRTLGSSFILSSDRKLTLQVVQDGNEHPIIGLDNEALSTRNVKKVEIRLSDKKIKTVKLKDNSFWEKVKRSFYHKKRTGITACPLFIYDTADDDGFDRFQFMKLFRVRPERITAEYGKVGIIAGAIRPRLCSLWMMAALPSV